MFVGVLLGVAAVGYVLAIRYAPTLLGVGVQSSPELQLTAEQNARVVVISAGAALGVAGGLIFTAVNYRLARRGQMLGQVASALTQLGSSEMYMRVGAISALEPLMRSSAENRDAILDVLNSFVQHRAPRWAENDVDPYQPELPERPDPDIQTALTVLGRFASRYGKPLDLRRLHLARVELADADLDGANLTGANLDGADLRRARLTAADLRETSLRTADLSHASLDDARLDHAILDEVQLRHVSLSGASLQEAELPRANLEHVRASSANLQGANLSAAKLWAAELQGVNLVGANLDGADLRYADLSGANLYRALLSRADLSKAKLSDANLEATNVWKTRISSSYLPATVVDERPLKWVRFVPRKSANKRLVICCDGIWGTQASGLAFTNVAAIADAVMRFAPDGTEQLTFHQRGRGSNTPAALRLDVLDVYRFLTQNFVPGDELYFFGFSRGAYVARTMVDLTSYGIVRPEHADRIEDAYAMYRSRDRSASPDNFSVTAFRHAYAYESTVRFLGVWETVGSLGIPYSKSRMLNPKWRAMYFHDTVLSRRVSAAFQALAIDEHRSAYEPCIWRTRPAPGQTVEQMWFPGTHRDVGGGNADGSTSLANISLKWMMHRARENGLALRDTSRSRRPDNPTAKMSDRSTDDRGRLLRPIGVADPDTEVVSATALVRMRDVEGYRPPNLLEYQARAKRDVGP